MTPRAGGSCQATSGLREYKRSSATIAGLSEYAGARNPASLAGFLREEDNSAL